MLVLLALFSLARACQEIQVKSTAGDVAVGRSLEFLEPFGYYMTSEPANFTHSYAAAPSCKTPPITFNNLYKVLAARVQYDGAWQETSPGGLNEQGLSAALLYFPHFAQFPDEASVKGSACFSALPHTAVTAYVLARYSRVQQLREDLHNDTFPPVFGKFDAGAVHPVHWNFVDTTGDSLVLEYSALGRRAFDNKVGAFANSPAFDWHVENLRNYAHVQDEAYARGWSEDLKPVSQGSGTAGLPGGYNSADRFVKAATLNKLTRGEAKTAEEAVLQCFHLMNAADLPRGLLKEAEEKCEKQPRRSRQKGAQKCNPNKQKKRLSDITYYISVKDLANKCIYFRAYNDQSIRRVCMDSVPDDKQSFVPIESHWRNAYTDVTRRLKTSETPF